MSNESTNSDIGRYGRREALKLGGLTVTVAALVSACGNGRLGDPSAGRVGYAPTVTDPQDYAVDDAVLLRTASSLELTAIAIYQYALDSGELAPDVSKLYQRLIDGHQAIADEMGALTKSVGGVAWTCTNPWYMERLVVPLLDAIKTSDNQVRDIINTSVSLENIGAATHQTFTVQLKDEDASAATIRAAALEARHAAAVVSIVRGADGYISPTISGGDAQNDPDGVPYNFAITSRFGSIGQIDLVVGTPNENGVRPTFTLQTPAENSYIYNELEPSC